MRRAERLRTQHTNTDRDLTTKLELVVREQVRTAGCALGGHVDAHGVADEQLQLVEVAQDSDTRRNVRGDNALNIVATKDVRACPVPSAGVVLVST
jgi:hypothetical protein